ncbi:DoxX family membrane protein [Aquicella lusitana]|uniref:DoxX-like protein n=1 Tax=Aquicella lusitana TaxID=254246 RepID=A0A370G057_9COXI|nr:DoxX family membrane protein [Aquicella lusitana]RDI37271.1 DoxX-like protein [Aquicella lusitana]VVC73648.1 hypothetical protein AQULUS_13950 [Aquicella lusitana]
MDILFTILSVLAHILIGGYFVFLGCWSIYHWVPIMETLVKKRVPHPYLLLPAGIGIQVVTGGMIMFGMFVKVAVLILIPATIVAVFIFHPFWHFRGELRLLNFTLFLANLTVTLGALLLLLVTPTPVI